MCRRRELLALWRELGENLERTNHDFCHLILAILHRIFYIFIRQMFRAWYEKAVIVWIKIPTPLLTMTLMLDAICSPSATIRINGADIPKSAVRERFLQLDSEHNESWFCCRSHFAIVNDWLLVFTDKTPRSYEYVLFAMERPKPAIRNIRTYLLTALYNAPATMDSYYSVLVSHDLNL